MEIGKLILAVTAPLPILDMGWAHQGEKVLKVFYYTQENNKKFRISVHNVMLKMRNYLKGNLIYIGMATVRFFPDSE